MGNRVAVDLEQETQIEERACSHLLPFAWGKPRITSLLRSFAKEAQRVEDSAWELFLLTDVATADLPRLKLLGKLIGQAQHALDTEQYRRAIIARAIANRSEGAIADIFRVLNSLLGSVEYTVVEPGNATLIISALDPLDESDFAVVREVLPFARAGGVGLQFLYTTEDDAPGGGSVFVFGDVWADDEYFGTTVNL